MHCCVCVFIRGDVCCVLLSTTVMGFCLLFSELCVVLPSSSLLPSLPPPLPPSLPPPLPSLQEFPLAQSPEVFGMHDNVDISRELKETKELFDSVLLTQSGASSGAGMQGSEQQLQEIATDILGKVCVRACPSMHSWKEHSSCPLFNLAASQSL